ncbi:retrotransposable element Tf2 [Tanacetum coccineum]
MKWQPKLMGYDYEVMYKKGLENGAADALSRLGSGNELLSMFVSSISTDLIQKVQATWVTDVDIAAIITSLKKGQVAKKHYVWVNEKLLRKGKIVVGQDEELRRKLLQYFYEDSIRGHSRGLPKSHGKDVIMVVVDKLRKDKIFISDFWKEFFKALKLKLHMYIAYHPQTNGQTEVVNRCLEGYLRYITGEQPKKWFEWLSLAELWYNTNFHTSINTTPFEVVYGQTTPIHVAYLGGLKGSLIVQPVKLLDRKIVKKNNKVLVYGLVQWANSKVDDASWEDLGNWLHNSLSLI